MAAAQPTTAPDPATCTADIAALEQAMDQARERGQMLRRRQLAEEMAALQARCEGAATVESRSARIARLEQEVLALRKALDYAQEQLRQARSAAP
ncbi:hypothetical protein ASF43_18660 [Pseudorhodoferax sp. Leaf267]|nr:hypothetical protein ASF43_18660 [Pseudorhodoferax sp. Leaf267]